ncbi:MAG: aldehyde dehydrogenase [Coxiella sp. (in: Bacteria)]|nr:MAG: aldehyde dehydrogenase [Coxiella sp. (in: g-proteobacteria)]
MSGKLNTISPVDGSVYVERDYATQAQIESALDQAKEAQAAWRNTPLEKRIAYCQQALTYFEKHKDAIADEITWQMGRPIKQAPGEIKGLIERANYMISIAHTTLKDTTPPQRNANERFIAREPVGTVFTIAPWNYPYLTAVNSLFPALLAGNTVILKHSSQTPLCAERFAAAFEAAELPKGVFQYLHIDYDATATIIAHPTINYVAFTGSVAGGRAVQKAASERFIGLGLELGGKDPAYVRADCDLSPTVENLVEGSFFNSGQSCCGVERIYVHDDVYDKFITEFTAHVEKYKLGNPTDPEFNLGPVVRTSAAKFIREQIDDAIEKGAKIANLNKSTATLPENYVQPHVLYDVTHHMRVMTEETFGPVVGIMKVYNDEQAIKLMNDSDYGLTASIWTRDQATGIALGRQIETGTVYINRCDYLDPALPWTGVKETGHGYSLSTLGFDQLTQAKSFNIN